MNVRSMMGYIRIAIGYTKESINHTAWSIWFLRAKSVAESSSGDIMPGIGAWDEGSSTLCTSNTVSRVYLHNNRLAWEICKSHCYIQDISHALDCVFAALGNTELT